jgi:heme a synthase
MHSMEQQGTTAPARLVHRLAVLAVCLVWPLIWVGGLVSTYDAGMAVPDWPSTWLLGPFDLLIEHGHRLLGAVVGFVAIGLLLAAYLKEPRRWVVWLATGVLLAVIGQGVLGGLRVVLGDRTLAMVHGCVGPAFFALCVATAVMTSRNWWRLPSLTDAELPKVPTSMVALAISLVVVSYLQLVLGAQLRHAQPNMAPGGFAMTVAIHVLTAFLLWLLTVVVWWGLRRCGDLTLSRPGAWLIGLLGFQIFLGVGTWVVNYGWPSFMHGIPGSVGFLLRSKGFLDSIIVTAHVATGSLILGVSTLVLVRLFRVRERRLQANKMINS